MAERPSVQEILEIVRRTGPPQPSGESEGAATGPEPPAEPAEPAPPEPEEASASAEPPPPAAAAPPPPPDPGRPLTLQEKLAAARGRPAGAAPTPPPAAPAPTPSAPEATEPSEAAPPPAPPAPPPDPGRPLTLQEKLAAARGRSAAATAPAAKAPTAKAAPAAKAATASTRELPPLEKITDPRDLAEALRRAGAAQEKKAKPTAKAEPAKAPTKKPAAAPRAVPPRPSRAAVAAPAGAPDEVQAERRGFLIGMSVTAIVVAGWASFVAGMALMLSMFGRFFFPNVLAEPPSTIKVGLPDTFEPEVVDERFLAEWGFWVIRSSDYDGIDKVYALQSVCTHLGCPPNWLASELKFKCPCHGSGFYISGVNFEGPAPRPLERFRVALADDGQILVDKSQLFQEELGQWTDPDSFIPV